MCERSSCIDHHISLADALSTISTTDSHTGVSSTAGFFGIIAVGACWVFWLAISAGLFKKREGTFHVEVRGEKDIIVVSRPPSDEATSRSSKSPLVMV